MILFIAGIFIGSAVGVIAMCILQVNRKKMVSVDLTIRNKKKEAKRYEAYLKKLGKKKGEQKK